MAHLSRSMRDMLGSKVDEVVIRPSDSQKAKKGDISVDGGKSGKYKSPALDKIVAAKDKKKKDPNNSTKPEKS